MTKDVASFTRDAWGGFQGAEAYLGMLKEIHYNIQPKHFNMTRGYYKGADSFAALEKAKIQLEEEMKMVRRDESPGRSSSRVDFRPSRA